MVRDLIEKREQVMDQVEKVVDAAWPERKGTEYTRAMQSAANEVESIANEMSGKDVSKIEQSRTYRYLGSVYSDLAPALGKEMLFKAKEAYEKAEVLMAGESNELERAKLDFNFANTLRQIDPSNSLLLSEAGNRLLKARKCFAKQAPQFVAQVDAALVSVEDLLKIAPLAIGVQEKFKSMQELHAELEHGGDVDKVASDLQELMHKDGGVAGTIAQFEALIADLAPDHAGSEKLAEIRKQLALVSGTSLKGKPLTDDEKQIWSSIRKRLEAEVSKGVISKDRAETVEQVLEQFGAIYSGGEEELSSMINTAGKIREFIASQFELNHYVSHGIERPPDGTRAAKLVELNWRLRHYLLEEMARPDKGEEESKELLGLDIRASKIDRRIYEAGADDARALNVEKEAFLPLAFAVRTFSARSYVMPAQPIWNSAKIAVGTNEVLYSGPQKFRTSVELVCRRLGLELMPEPKGESPAVARWNLLQKAVTAIFDLRAEEGSEKASVAYEMGIALTLGKPVVVLIASGSVMPFDVDVDPVLLDGGPGDEAAMNSAIDKSLVWVYSRPRADTSANTIEYLLKKYERPHPNVYADQTLKVLSEMRQKPDALTVSRTIAKLFEYLDDGRTMTIQPVWSPAYPAKDAVRLFHVMPFRPDWAEKVTEVTRQVSEGLRVKYVRGDEIANPDVVRSIWEEIARASHVLVDLTGFNANVAMELGIAHTLGKNVLVVGQGNTADNLFQMVSKLRLQQYDMKRIKETYATAVEKFVQMEKS